jgi:hypothetical protein
MFNFSDFQMFMVILKKNTFNCSMLVNSFVVLQLGKYWTKSWVSKILLNAIVEMFNVNEIVVFGSRKNDHELNSKKNWHKMFLMGLI